MDMMTQLHPLFTDPLFQYAMRDAEQLLNSHQYFLRNPKQPIYNLGIEYTKWVYSIGIPKKAVKWFAPLWVNAAPRNITYAVFGRDAAPIAQLGDRSVSAFIRYLIFDKGMTLDGVRYKLIDQMGYDPKSARPLVHRVGKDLDKSKTYFEEHQERELFKDFANV